MNYDDIMFTDAFRMYIEKIHKVKLYKYNMLTDYEREMIYDDISKYVKCSSGYEGELKDLYIDIIRKGWNLVKYEASMTENMFMIELVNLFTCIDIHAGMIDRYISCDLRGLDVVERFYLFMKELKNNYVELHTEFCTPFTAVMFDMCRKHYEYE